MALVRKVQNEVRLSAFQTKTNANYTHVEDGSVAQIKALTLCLRKEWYRVHGHGEGLVRPNLTDSDLKWMMGTAVGDYLNTNQLRITWELPSGKVSGRLDDWTVRPSPEEIPTPFVPIEYKLTWGGKKDDPSSQYQEQLMSYMTALKSPYGELDIFHMVGGGPSGKAFSPAPYLEVFELHMEPWEMIEWALVVDNRLEKVLAPDPPDFPDMHYGWECGYCEYKKAGICHAPKGTKV